MNIIDFISRNIFLKQIFPNGLTESVLLGQIGLNVGGQLSLNIHTQQKPEQEVSKWGIWGKNYNVIVIRLLGLGGENVIINGCKKINYGKINVIKGDNRTFITQTGDEWFIEIDVDHLIFQGCDTYIDGGDDPAL
ncbi:hypothetical protein [Photorhabdus bodei]|uniref:Uncharacterized protein n=1 Tax=Photorhabdus bodei TaxID=2029681 RepID=A0AAW6BP28_9GAMM|nr:hypothetical protein [Photorhabdus bodei]MCC8466700.1 hypothetical protein [Photorhabdus bodei]MDB6375182.1 hypothetical protein [Photorhabdus bodei]